MGPAQQTYHIDAEKQGLRRVKWLPKAQVHGGRVRIQGHGADQGMLAVCGVCPLCGGPFLAVINLLFSMKTRYCL